MSRRCVIGFGCGARFPQRRRYPLKLVIALGLNPDYIRNHNGFAGYV